MVLAIATASFFTVASPVGATGGSSLSAGTSVRAGQNRAYFNPLETADHVPIVDGMTLPVGTVVDGNLWVRVRADLRVAQGVIAVTDPQSLEGPSWNSRTPEGTIVTGDHLVMRFYQTLTMAGDWYFAAKIRNHTDGSLGTPTVVEVHVVP